MRLLDHPITISNTANRAALLGVGLTLNLEESLLVSPNIFQAKNIMFTLLAAGLFDGASMIEILKTGKMQYLGIL